MADAHFERAPAAVRKQCRRTAATLRYPVLCPTVVPELNFPTEFDCRPTGGPTDVVGTGCLTFRRWQVTSLDYVGEHDEGHVVMKAAPRPVSYRTFIMGPGVEGRVRMRIGAPQRVGRWRGREIRVISAPGSSLAGHTVFIWRTGRQTYGVGFHGHGTAARALNRYVIRNSQLVD